MLFYLFFRINPVKQGLKNKKLFMQLSANISVAKVILKHR